MEREAEAKDNLWRARLDAVLMHRIWGSLIFLGIVYIIFFLSFAIGDPLVRLIQTGTQLFSVWACRMLEPWPRLQSLLGEGVVGGVGGVLAFLPNVVLLFGAITVLENSGYMMRVSRLMSRIMKIMGLNGSSFAPSCWDSAVRFPPSCPPGELKRAATAWSPSPCCP
ncbi:MAG: nucleoside recognition domain-containing protein [Akkermansia muciniphila]|nr:nucleoside recognition domain-containing protein [Akkermansia muciniphila]